MIKELIKQMQQRNQKKKVQREILRRQYPLDQLYYGETTKRIDEDGICFEYDHSECFLVVKDGDSDTFIRLTGEGSESSNLEIYSVKDCLDEGVKSKQYYVSDYYGAYLIDTLEKWGFNGYMRLDEIINQIDWINKRAKERAKTEAVLDNK